MSNDEKHFNTPCPKCTSLSIPLLILIDSESEDYLLVSESNWVVI